MKRLHLVCGTLNDPGGVGDYTAALAGALSSRGITTMIWEATAPGVRQALPALLRRDPAPVIVQYVPNAFGAKGANLWFCATLLTLRRQGHDVRVMFHEPYFYFSAHPLRNGLAIVQRLMAVILLRASPVSYLSTETWRDYLAPYAPRGAAFVSLPVPATVARGSQPAREREWRTKLLSPGTRFLVGHFGTYGEHVATCVQPIVTALVKERPDVTVVCVGNGGESFVEAIRRVSPHVSQRIVATGALGSEDVAAVLRACEVLVQPYPDGVTTRRTSLMAGIANEVATVTSDGPLTEPVWQASGGVVLAPAGDPAPHVREVVRLLDDAALRRAQARRGVELYDAQFSIDRVVDTLIGQPLAATA
jgi:hypothetical protein